METFHIHKYGNRLLVSYEFGAQTLGLVVDIGHRGSVDVNVHGIGDIRVNTHLNLHANNNNQTSKGGHIMPKDNETFKDKDSDKIVVWKETYKKLVEDSKFLESLRDAGVDNWDGYGYAQDLMEDK